MACVLLCKIGSKSPPAFCNASIVKQWVHVVDDKTLHLLNDLRKYPGVAELRLTGVGQGPVMPMTFVKSTRKFSYFSMITTVGTPQCITAQEFRIECMFPA